MLNGDKNNMLKKFLIILAIILIVYFLFMTCVFIKISNSSIFLNDNVRQKEITKLKKALISEDFVEVNENKFEKVQSVKYFDDGEIKEFLKLYFDFNTNVYSMHLYNAEKSYDLELDYFYKSNIVQGSHYIFYENLKGIKSSAIFMYDFNNGTNTCDSSNSEFCEYSSLIFIKEYFDDFIKKYNINIDNIK